MIPNVKELQLFSMKPDRLIGWVDLFLVNVAYETVNVLFTLDGLIDNQNNPDATKIVEFKKEKNGKIFWKPIGLNSSNSSKPV